MNEISQATQVAPAAFIDRLLDLNRRLRESPENAQFFNAWQVTLERGLLNVGQQMGFNIERPNM